MQKIIVLGPSGAGKSTFSRALAKKLNLPRYCLDNIFWHEDKTHITREEFDEKLASILEENQWIIDGDFHRTYEVRFAKCDTVFFLDYPLELCLKSIEGRIGKQRDDCPFIEHEFDPEFREWIINWFNVQRPELFNMIEKYKNKNIVIFKSREEATKFLESL